MITIDKFMDPENIRKGHALSIKIGQAVFEATDDGLDERFAWHSVLVAFSAYLMSCEHPEQAAVAAHNLVMEYVKAAEPMAAEVKKKHVPKDVH